MQFRAGGELTGGAFGTDASNSAGLNNAVVTYYEIRTGAGGICTGWKGIAADFGRGLAFERKSDFKRMPALAATQGAP